MARSALIVCIGLLLNAAAAQAQNSAGERPLQPTRVSLFQKARFSDTTVAMVVSRGPAGDMIVLRYGEMKPELVAMAARLLLSDDRPLSPGARHDLIVRRGTPASQVTQEQLLWAKQALAALQGAPESDHATVGRAKKVDLKLPRP